MGDVEMGPQRVGHPVVQPQPRVGEGDPRQAGGVVHLLPGLQVLRVPVGLQQVAVGQLQGLFRRRVGEVRPGGGHERAKRYAQISRLLRLDSSSVRQSALQLIRTIRNSMDKLGMPSTIKDAGVPQAEFEADVEV